MKKYLNIYLHILKFSLKLLFEYRTNAVIRLLYAPAYAGIMFLILQTVFSKTPSLGGWDQAHGIMIFFVYQLMYSSFIFVFIDAMRDMMWNLVREGGLDSLLVKPVNVQFLATFRKPHIDSLLLFLSSLILFLRQIFIMQSEITGLHFLFFVVSFSLSWLIGYFVLTSYATVSLYVTKAQEVVEMLDKFTDYSQYPTSIFPGPVQLIAFTIIPFAFFSYVPTSLLFGRMQPSVILWMIPLLGTAVVVNQLAWRTALRHYSSASS